MGYSGTERSHPASPITRFETVLVRSPKRTLIVWTSPAATIHRACPFESVNWSADPAMRPSAGAALRGRDGVVLNGFDCGSSSTAKPGIGRLLMCPTTVIDRTADAPFTGCCDVTVRRVGAVGELQAETSTAAAIRMVRIPSTIRKGSR